MRKIKRGLILLLALLAMTTILTSTVSAKPKLNEKKITIEKGKKRKLKVNGTKKKVKWSSKNKRIAKVNKRGLVIGVRTGKTTIIAKVGGKKLKCKVTVVDGRNNSFNPPKGNQTKIDDKTRSSNNQSTTTNNKSNTTTNATKTTTSKASTTNNQSSTSSKSSNANSQPSTTNSQTTNNVVLPTSVTIPSLYVDVEEEGTTNLTATVSPDNTTNKTVKWSSENSGIATVDSEGKVTGVSVGKVKITARCGNKSDYCYVTVNYRQPTENRDYKVRESEVKFYENNGEQYYNAIYEITNVGGKNLKLKSAIYDVYDNSDRLVSNENMISCDPEIIKPGEKGYVWNNFKSLDVPLGNYYIKPTFKFERTDESIHYYPISNLSKKEDEYGIVKILGTITNDTNKKISYLYVTFLHYDEKGNVVGIHGTSVTDIAPRATQGFEGWGLYMAEYLTYDMLKNYKVIAADVVY